MPKVQEEMTYREGVINQLASIKNDVSEIRVQTTKTNGSVIDLDRRANKTDIRLAIIGTALATALALKFPFIAHLLASGL